MSSLERFLHIKLINAPYLTPFSSNTSEYLLIDSIGSPSLIFISKSSVLCSPCTTSEYMLHDKENPSPSKNLLGKRSEADLYEFLVIRICASLNRLAIRLIAILEIAACRR